MLNNNRNLILLFSIGISISGLSIVLFLAFNPPVIGESLFWRKPLVGSIFSLVCVLGILAAIFPMQCSHSFHSETGHIHSAAGRIGSGSHHRDCGAFSAHVICINNHAFCAACTGLILGALMALFGSFFYFFGGSTLKNSGFPLALAGLIATVLGFFQLKFRGVFRLVLNAFFVLGAFMILIGIDALVESLFADLFLLASIVFWIFTRILLSQWDHLKICSSCKSPCDARKT